MGTGGDGPGDRLHVDVAQVRARQPVLREQPVEIVDRGTGTDRDELAVDLRHARQKTEIEADAVGLSGGGERMPGTGRFDPPALGACLFDQVSYLVDGSRPDRRRGVPYVSGPVGPFVVGHVALPSVKSGTAADAYVGAARCFE